MQTVRLIIVAITLALLLPVSAKVAAQSPAPKDGPTVYDVSSLN